MRPSLGRAALELRAMPQLDFLRTGLRSHCLEGHQPDDGGALAVRDGVEDLADGVRMIDRTRNRVRRLQRI
jgi:hypothetical protein